MRIEFLRPWALVLFPVLLGIILWMSRSMRIRSRAKKAGYLLLRCVILLLLVLALSGVRLQKDSKATTTIFLVDVSDSMGENVQEAESFVRASIAELPAKNQTGIVIFGADAKIEQFVTDKKLFTEIQSQALTTATNLEQAVQTALAMFPEESAKRLVLLTDGVQNEGEITNLASTFSLHDIELKIMRYDSISGDEVYVSDLSVPDVIHVGDQFQVQADIYSNTATEAVVTLYSGRILKGQQSVVLQKGNNRLVFLDEGVETGLQNYRVTVEAAKDTLSANNSYSAFTQIDSKPRILAVEGEAGIGQGFRDILDACGYSYDMVTPSGVPDKIAELAQYKSVILINVYLDDLREGFTDCLESYVKDYAGGLIVAGGEDSYALGNYQDSVLEEILPVSMSLEGEKEIPKMAIALVIDHSGSMGSSSVDGGNSGTTCMDIAKQAAVSALDSLRPVDEIGVLAFDDRFDWAVPLQEADDLDAIKSKINSVQVAGGTSIYPALEEAVKSISKSDAQIKHIILLTDGQDGYNQYDTVLDTIQNEGITLSTVAVGSGADTRTMERLAEQGNGRYYYSDASKRLPRIFAQEIFLSGKSYLINEEFVPVIVNSHDIIQNIFTDGSPSLYGYIAATPKQTATVVLESHRGDPILTLWQCGLGKTIAWNTDATNQWTKDFAGWGPYAQLWRNMIDYTISDTQLGGDSLEVVSHSTSATVIYAPENYTTETQITAVVTDENGEKQEISFYPTAPGKYEGEIPMSEQGVYSINIRNQQGEEIVKNVNTAAAMQYSVEYRLDGSTASLEQFAEQTGGIWITSPDQVFDTVLNQVKAKTDMTDLFLWTAVFLFLADIFVRRWNLDYMEQIAKLFRKIHGRLLAWNTQFRKKKAAKSQANGEVSGRHLQEEKEELKSVQSEVSGTEEPETAAKKKTKASKGSRKQRGDSKKSRKQNAVQVIDTAALLKKKEERE